MAQMDPVWVTSTVMMCTRRFAGGHAEALTPLVVVMGALPAIPFAVLAWRIARS